jgi:hypothetical protein
VGAANVSLAYSRFFYQGFVDNLTGAPEYLINSWSQERYEKGLPIDFPRLTIGNNQLNNYSSSTMFTADASYLRLKNLEIGYAISPNYLRKVGLKSARIYANANNLFTWSTVYEGADPESPARTGNEESYPLTRTMNFGMNINF